MPAELPGTHHVARTRLSAVAKSPPPWPHPTPATSSALIDNGTLVVRPPAIAAENHLFLGIHDIVEPQDGLIAPAEEHVAELLDFVRGWDRSRPMVVHCFAGISRSTASAFIALCAVRPERSESEIARQAPQRLALCDAQSPARRLRRPAPRPQGPHGRGDRTDRPRRLRHGKRPLFHCPRGVGCERRRPAPDRDRPDCRHRRRPRPAAADPRRLVRRRPSRGRRPALRTVRSAGSPHARCRACAPGSPSRPISSSAMSSSSTPSATAAGTPLPATADRIWFRSAISH